MTMPKQIDVKVTTPQNKYGHGTAWKCLLFLIDSYAHRYHAQIEIYIVRQLTSQTPMCTFTLTVLQLIFQSNLLACLTGNRTIFIGNVIFLYIYLRGYAKVE